jgi:hypothetical protein
LPCAYMHSAVDPAMDTQSSVSSPLCLLLLTCV